MRIYFSMSHTDRFAAPAYAVMRDPGDGTRSQCVARAIARKNGLEPANLQSGLAYEENGRIVSRDYELTLGKYERKEGSFRVDGRVFFTVYRGEEGD